MFRLSEIARCLVAVLALAAGTLGTAVGVTPTVQPIREIQRATAVHSFHQIEMAATGVVTWVDPAAGRDFYIQDDSGGIQVIMGDASLAWPEIGDLVTVEGLLGRGEFAPAIRRASFVVHGDSELPETQNVSGDVLLNGGYSCERVRLDGWIRAAEKVDPTTLSVVIGSGGARITVRISDAAGLNAEELVATRMVVSGVVTPVKPRGGTRQLVDVRVLSHPSFCNIIEREARNPWFAPVVSLAKAFSKPTASAA